MRVSARATRRANRPVTRARSAVPFLHEMSDLAIDIRNVVKRYDEHVAVSDLSLAVPRGTVYGLLGPNGAGKTTTIRMLLNIIVPDSGTITLLGTPHRTRGLTDRIGYLPEERGLYKKMQVRRVLRFLAELKGVPGREAERRIDDWLTRLELKTPERDWGLARWTSSHAACSRRCSSSARCCTIPISSSSTSPSRGSTRSTRRRSRTRSSSSSHAARRSSSART